MPRWRTLFRVVLVSLPLVVLGWLVSCDLVPSGHLVATTDFSQFSPYIFPLSPTDRLLDHRSRGSAEQPVVAIDDPLYFDVRLPRTFDTLTLALEYRAPAEQPVRLAVFQNKDTWTFDAKDFDTVEPLPDGWQRGTVTFSLTDKRFVFNKYQAMLSLPGIRGSGRQVAVRRLSVTATRPPLTWPDVWQRLTGRLHIL